jgi:hypothetical protein
MSNRYEQAMTHHKQDSSSQAAGASEHNTMTAWHPLLRPVGRLVIAAQLMLCLQPLSVLAQDTKSSKPLAQWLQTPANSAAKPAQAALQNAAPTVVMDRTAKNLGQAHELIKSLQSSGTASRRSTARDTPAQQAMGHQRDQEQLNSLLNHLEAVDADADAAVAEFKASRADLAAKGLSPEILARHDQTVAELQTRTVDFRQRLRAFQAQPSTSTLAIISQHFDQYPAAKAHTPLDPSKLPWSSPKPNTRAPATTKTAWHQNLYADQRIKLAQAGGSNIGGIQFNIPPEPGNAPTAADLAASPEVTLSPAIKAKALELGNNPVAIHNWVRNTVQWLPTWGAIQSADSTLASLKGNAFDIASLEIALLRAASIPARYQFGTIDIPVDKVQNWVGGTTKPEAALQLLNQGGIAATGIAQGGVIQTIRMEHVWVNAYVNWTPSRGNRQGGGTANPKLSTPDGILQHVNPNGPLNAWVPLDGSFKQYSYSAGMDLKTNVPLDSTALLAAIQQDSTTVNNTAGWVQSLSQTGIQSQLTTYQARLQTYADTQKANASIADVFGQKTITPLATSLLAGTTPYTVALQGTQATVVPDALRWKISLKLFASANDKAADSPLFTQPLLFSQIGSKRLSASAIAASPADQALLDQYAGANATSLPVYLIRQKTQLKLDDLLLVETAPQRMGDTQLWNYVLSGPDFGSVEEDFKYENAVGDAIAFSIDATGVRYSDVATRASAVNPDTTLENLHQFGLGYWSRANEADAITAKSSNVITTRLPSIGLFTSPLSVVYSWGVPRIGKYSSYAVDIRRLNTAVTGIANPAATLDYMKQAGARNSFLEGRNFEEMLGLAPNAAASAVAVRAAANEQGVPIWQLNANNLQQYLALATVSLSTQNQVTDAVNNGLDVLVPQGPVQLMRWTGQGYIATDPQTGAGAYIVDGVGNGGEVETCEVKVQPLVEAITQKLLTQAAIRLALMLMAEAGLATAGAAFPPAAPALAQAMVMVGISFLTFPAQAVNPACAKAEKDCHRTIFQAQGGKGSISAEESTKWEMPTPLTKAQAYVLIDQLQAKLTTRQLEARAIGFAQMKSRITSLPATGVCSPWTPSFPQPPLQYGVRADIEVRAGQAFVD